MPLDITETVAADFLMLQEIAFLECKINIGGNGRSKYFEVEARKCRLALRSSRISERQ